ncbi:hypothetical protein Afil01_28850 [Actinorhabdospora filicis]|uniref:Uncharacterized protein n=1 Tax=Actinorhabdospora filicis TaxID=1785913 RepID=A0A9W6SKT6_9ACTN|nr:hypothetical protein Afil01_28850 [Actinorhabdospora filicis]
MGPHRRAARERGRAGRPPASRWGDLGGAGAPSGGLGRSGHGTKGRLAACYAVPDSGHLDAYGSLAERVRKSADNEQLLGGRVPLREV